MKLIQPGYPVLQLSHYAETKLSPLQRKQIDELGLDLPDINRRYHNILERCRIRNAPKPDRYAFIRALVSILAKTSAGTGKSPAEILKTYNVHAINLHDYSAFQLLPQNIHRGLHASSKQSQLYRCKYCNQLKTKNEFVKDSRIKEGIELTCKTCKKALREEFKTIKGAL